MKVSFRPAVATDLTEIGQFISQNNPARAITFVSELIAKCQAIASNPMAGRPRDEIEFGLRSRVYRKYVIFYRTEEDRIRIMRIVHGARDLPRLKF